MWTQICVVSVTSIASGHLAEMNCPDSLLRPPSFLGHAWQLAVPPTHSSETTPMPHPPVLNVAITGRLDMAVLGIYILILYSKFKDPSIILLLLANPASRHHAPNQIGSVLLPERNRSADWCSTSCSREVAFLSYCGRFEGGAT